jgi:hypothetical protein
MVINVINIAQTRIFLKMCVLLINKHSKTVVLLLLTNHHLKTHF